MLDIEMEVRGGRLVPTSPIGVEDLAPYEGEKVHARLTRRKSRSLTQTGLYFAVCGAIAENLDANVTKEMIDQTLRIEAGHCDVVKFPDGRYRYQPRSVAFNRMSGDEFSRYMDRAFHVAAQIFGPALTEAAWRKVFERRPAHA